MVVTPPFRLESIQPIWFWRGVQSPATGWTWLSMRPGVTYFPAPSMTTALAGASTVAPMAAILPSRISTAPFVLIIGAYILLTTLDMPALKNLKVTVDTLDTLGFQAVRDIEPGEAIFIDEQGRLHSNQCVPTTRHTPCIFEYVYFSRPDSTIAGMSTVAAPAPTKVASWRTPPILIMIGCAIARSHFAWICSTGAPMPML